MKKITFIFLMLLISLTVNAKTVKIITTGDMHGWIESQSAMKMKVGGTAEMLTNWKNVEKYSPDNTLILSAGDNFTGAAISGITEGDSVVDLMNIMKYDATTIGNHEFDYGASKIAAWKKKALFEFLSANIYSNDNKAISWQKPYKIFTRDGVKVAVIGLTTTDLRVLTNNANDFTITKYQDTLRELVPLIRKEGAETIIVLAHVDQDNLIDLSKKCADLNIPLYIGGHSHEFAQRFTGTSWVVNSGEWWKGYSVIEIEVNKGMSVVTSSKQVFLWGNIKPDIDAENLIEKWKNNTDRLLDEKLGYTVTGIKTEPSLYNMLTDVWLSSYPAADAAICNYGALRQPIKPGVINYGTILGIMPFLNKLVIIEIKGDKFLQALPVNGRLGFSGLKKNGNQYLLKNGEEINKDKVYQIIMTDYQADVTPLYKESRRTVICNSWRDPVIKWLIENKTSALKPLELLIDAVQR